MNTLKCGACFYYDPQIKSEGDKLVPKTFGRCGKRSLYPFAERDGQVFPEGATRVEEGTLPRPDQIRIVNAEDVVKECLFAIKKKGA